MPEQELSLKCVYQEQDAPVDLTAIVAEARNSVDSADDGDIKKWMQESIGLLANGNCRRFILLDGEKTVGVMRYDIKGDDAQIHFSHVQGSYGNREEWFFRAAVSAFRSMGVKVVRTNLHWPSQERYLHAAQDLGFAVMERISMTRESDDSYPGKLLQAYFELHPWSESYFNSAGRLLFEEANPVDRRIYPQLQSLEGACAHLRKIVDNSYGSFLPGQSLVAVSDGRLIGLLMATIFEGDAILIAEIAVAQSHRGRGIASTMMSRFIRDTAVALGRRKIELVVNSFNGEAIRLYHSKGFTTAETFKQYVLVFPDNELPAEK